MSIAKELREEIVNSIHEKQIKTGTQKDQSWLDPAYAVISIKCEEIVPQACNPNYQSENAFKALQTSILNNGMAFPVLVAKNPNYDPSTEGLPKPKVFAGGQDVVDVRDPEIRKYFKYTVVDGTHRLLAVLYGSPMYTEFNNKNSQEIYKRCEGYIPCTVLEDKTEQELMSAEILFNPIAAQQELYVLREVEE